METVELPGWCRLDAWLVPGCLVACLPGRACLPVRAWSGAYRAVLRGTVRTLSPAARRLSNPRAWAGRLS